MTMCSFTHPHLRTLILFPKDRRNSSVIFLMSRVHVYLDFQKLSKIACLKHVLNDEHDFLQISFDSIRDFFLLNNFLKQICLLARKKKYHFSQTYYSIKYYPINLLHSKKLSIIKIKRKGFSVLP